MINSVFRTDNNYYPEVFLEECKFIIKEKKIPKHIIDNIEISSDSDRENSDEENLKQTKIPKRSTWKISKYFWKRKNKWQKKVQERYKNVPQEEEKDKKRQYHCERNKNLS